MNLNLSKELLYVILIFALFVLPRIIQRFRIPTAVTSMLLGIAINHWYPQIAEDATVNLLATLGIVALFLFAGLDLKLNDVKSGGWILVQHIILGLLNIFIAGFIVMSMFKLSMSISMLVALALFTPSTGFILDSLRSIGVNETERFWIKSISIAAEIVALLLMFIIIQSTSLPKFISSTLIMALLILFLPILFKLFAEKIVPYAPNSEFAFLLIIALFSAFITYKIGVYYLVGAFIVGITAQRFRQNLSSLTSEKMVNAIEVFASFFIPFYFFRAGLHVNIIEIDLKTISMSLIIILTIIPTRILLTALHLKIARKETFKTASKIGIAISPTLVFSLVIAEILKIKFAVPLYIYGSIWIYALVNTMLPGFLLRIPPVDFESPHFPHNDAAKKE